jgi:paraquat-inducible protein A
VRCGAVLYRRSRLRLDQLLALVVGALVTFLLANAFPIVDLEVQGIRNSTTLAGSVLALWGEGRWPVAILVCLTTQVFPVIDLLAMLVLLAAAQGGWSFKGPVVLVFRFVRVLRPWGMIEVFMLGTLVALVKLSHLAHVMPGVALWAFGALTVMTTVVVSFDPSWILADRR